MLDKQTAGLHKGDLYIVAARPGMGKTSFVLNLAVNVASPASRSRSPAKTSRTWKLRSKSPATASCSSRFEMPREQLAARMLSSEGARRHVRRSAAVACSAKTGTSSPRRPRAWSAADVDRRHARAHDPRSPRQDPALPGRDSRGDDNGMPAKKLGLRRHRLLAAHEGSRATPAAASRRSARFRAA